MRCIFKEEDDIKKFFLYDDNSQIESIMSNTMNAEHCDFFDKMTEVLNDAENNPDFSIQLIYPIDGTYVGILQCDKYDVKNMGNEYSKIYCINAICNQVNFPYTRHDIEKAITRFAQNKFKFNYELRFWANLTDKEREEYDPDIILQTSVGPFKHIIGVWDVSGETTVCIGSIDMSRVGE